MTKTLDGAVNILCSAADRHATRETPDGTGPLQQAQANRQLDPLTFAPVNLTRDQQIRLTCMRVQVEASTRQIVAGRKRVPNDEFRGAVDSLVHYVTTGNWPDTNGPTD